jgi:hypothetical protein
MAYRWILSLAFVMASLGSARAATVATPPLLFGPDDLDMFCSLVNVGTREVPITRLEVVDAITGTVREASGDFVLRPNASGSLLERPDIGLGNIGPWFCRAETKGSAASVRLTLCAYQSGTGCVSSASAP